MRQLGKQPVHDLVIRSIPTLWEKNGQQFVEINAGSIGMCAPRRRMFIRTHRLRASKRSDSVAVVAEVETEDTSPCTRLARDGDSTPHWTFRCF